MNRYYYDLHMHSCLSPCADDDMTPNNMIGMGTLCGLQIMALTDHNTTKNCPAFFEAAAKHGIIPIAGMELTTACACLTPSSVSGTGRQPACALSRFAVDSPCRIRYKSI